MRHFHFINMDRQYLAEINHHEWVNSVVKHHQSQEDLGTFLKLPSENFVFLDIDSNSESENLKDIAKLHEITNRIIIVSKDTAFAYKAIKAGVHDYVLKVNFIKDILGICQQSDKANFSSKQRSNRVAIHCTEAVHYLYLNDIIRCQAESNYTRIILTNKTLLIAKTLKKVEALLPSSIFFRSHRSHIVNLKHVKMIRHEKGGTIVTSDDHSIPVSRSRKSCFVDQIQSITM